MKAELLVRWRIPLTDASFVEMVAWRVPVPLTGSDHPFKYRFAYVVNGTCVLRYDNETGKGDHMHVGEDQRPYPFSSVDRLVRDFMDHVKRMRS